MTEQTVIVNKVENVKAGKVDRVVLHYSSERTKGEVWKIGALLVNLDEISRTNIKTIKPGDLRTIEMQKEGNFWNLTKVSIGETTPSTYSKNTPDGKLTDVEKGEGQERGNLRSNAVAIVIAKGVKDYKTAIKDVEIVYKNLKDAFNNAEASADANPYEQEEANAQDLDVPELDF